MTMLALVDQPAAPESGDARAHKADTFELADFAHHPVKQRQRVAALLKRGLKMDGEALQRIGISPPRAETEMAVQGRDAGSTSNVMHLDQLKSLADGHLQFHRHLFEAGRRPALEPSESLGRVGVGSDASSRPVPSSGAMMTLAPSLRLELAQARDLPAGELDALGTMQRLRTQALVRGLTCQREGEPRSLAEQVVVLLALIDGRLDNIAHASAAEAATELSRVIARVHEIAPTEIRTVDTTQALSAESRRVLTDALAEALPNCGGRRALFVTWEPEQQ